MKILQVIPYFPPAYIFGGPVRVAYQISKELTNRGHEVVVYTTDAKDFHSRIKMISGNTEGIKVQYFKNISLVFIRKLKLFITPQVISSARKEVKKFDLIHLHEYRSFQNVIIHHYAHKWKIPYILQAHGSIPRIGSWKKLKIIYDIFFGYRLLRDASKVIALSRFEAEQYRRMGVPKDKVVIIPNGIDLSEYSNLPPKGFFKNKYNIPEEKKIILYLGRIHRIKGIDFLIKAYAYLTEEIGYKDAILIIAGPDDGYLNEAKTLTKTLNIEDSVMFTGPLYGRDKLEAYVDAEFYVLPSRYETFPMTVLETYACAKPVIASNLGGLKDLVLNGETGLLFETGNFRQLAENMFYLLNNEEKTLEIGLNGRAFVEKNFSIERVVDNLERLYNEVVLERR
ncbi:MAG: glycosyltransferase family 4 protein [Candidatus Bathyarchaeia archaeon]